MVYDHSLCRAMECGLIVFTYVMYTSTLWGERVRVWAWHIPGVAMLTKKAKLLEESYLHNL